MHQQPQRHWHPHWHRRLQAGFRRSLRWRLFSVHALLLILAIGTVTLIEGRIERKWLLERNAISLERVAKQCARFLPDDAASRRGEQLLDLVEALGVRHRPDDKPPRDRWVARRRVQVPLLVEQLADRVCRRSR